MSLAQRAEQAVLQERALEGQNEGHGGEPHTVTIVGSGAAGNGLASGGTIQVRGLGQMAAGATLQLAQLAGGQVTAPNVHFHTFHIVCDPELLRALVFSARINLLNIKVIFLLI